MSPTGQSQQFTSTDAMLLLMTSIWAVNFSVTKYASAAFEPRAFAGLRVGLSAFVLVSLALLARAPLPPLRDLLTLLAVGVIGHGVYQLLFIEGLARTRAGNAALIIAATPAFIAAASRWRGIERVRRRSLAGIAFSVVGVAAIVLGSATSRSGQTSVAGTLLVFAGVLCWTAFTISLYPFTAGTHPLTLAAVTIVGGVFPLLVATAPALARTEWSAVPAAVWPAVFYSSVFAMVIAYLFWYRGVRVLGPTRTAVYANVQPIIALVVAWITLGETPTMWQGLGTATIITGVFFTRS
jgi:drug/metabolite transporter (DMT)-like permease